MRRAITVQESWGLWILGLQYSEAQLRKIEKERKKPEIQDPQTSQQYVSSSPSWPKIQSATTKISAHIPNQIVLYHYSTLN